MMRHPPVPVGRKLAHDVQEQAVQLPRRTDVLDVQQLVQQQLVVHKVLEVVNRLVAASTYSWRHTAAATPCMSRNAQVQSMRHRNLQASCLHQGQTWMW